MAKQRRLSRKEKRKQQREMEHMVGILNQKFSMRKITPLTPSQSDLFDSYLFQKNDQFDQSLQDSSLL